VGHSGRAIARQTHAPDRSQPGRRRQSLRCPAGDYIFTAACKPTVGFLGQIYVYRAGDGGFVGRISAPKEIAQNTGWIDLSHGIRARELGGTYYITQEDNLRAKVILYIWKP